MKNKSQTSIVLTFFLVLSVLFVAVVAQNVNESVNGTVDEPNGSLFSNETTFLTDLLPLNETISLNESLVNETLNETLPSFNETNLNDIPLNESNETILNDTEENLTIPEQIIESILNETTEVLINESLPELNETNESVALIELNLSEVNETENVTMPVSNQSRENQTNESVPRQPHIFRLKAGATSRINASGQTPFDVTVIGVNTQQGFAVIRVDGQDELVRTGQNITLRGRSFTIEEIAFVEFRRVPEPEVRVRVSE